MLNPQNQRLWIEDLAGIEHATIFSGENRFKRQRVGVGLDPHRAQHRRAKEAYELRFVVGQRKIAVEPQDAAVGSSTRDILVLSILNIELRREPLKRDIVAIEEEGLHPQANVILPVETVSIFFDKGDELLVFEPVRRQLRSRFEILGNLIDFGRLAGPSVA